MLCCVSRKASPRSNNHQNNESNQNHENHENQQKSILHPDPSSSSGISSSSFDTSDNFNSSVTSGLTSSSSSSCNTSGFSSSSPIIRVFANSSTDSISMVSEFLPNIDESSNFLADNSSVIRTIKSTDTKFPEVPKRMQTFSAPAKRDNSCEASINVNLNLERESSNKDETTELLPCAICARTFKPVSLEKHTKICELAAIKKRKPFDSAKQRIQGTELAEFLPKETIKRKIYQAEEKTVSVTNNKGSWKQTHDEFLRAIREARGETMKVTPQRQLVAPNNVTVIGVPTRPNEKGMCPTCNRQFSIKSYERHVAWCKERATRVPMSAATNIAKERLEARMKYRVPALKNRRATNREKYSPISAMNLTNLTSKMNNGNLTNQRAKETASSPICNNNKGGGNENSTGNSQSQKSTVDTRRSGQSREGISSGPMKSRLSDRSSRPSGENDSGTTSNCPSPGHQNSSRISNNPLNRYSRNSPTSTNYFESPISTVRTVRKNETSTKIFDENDENDEKIDEKTQKSRDSHEGSMKIRRNRKNIVHARSHGNPRVNDITINDDTMGMIVQPCVAKKIHNNVEEFPKLKKIVEDSSSNNEFFKFNLMGDSKFIQESARSEEIDSTSVIDDKSNRDEENCLELENISWTSKIEELDRTYLIRESLDVEADFRELRDERKRKPVIDSPRVEFYYDKRSMEKLFFGNTNDMENSTGFTRRKKKEDRKKFDENSCKIKSPSFSGCSRLEPLNLTIIDNDDNPEYSETLRSEKSTKSLGKTPRRGELTKNSPKLKPIFGIESSRLDSYNFEISHKKNDDALINERYIANLDSKNENMQILETPRSTKSTKTLKNNFDKLSTKKINSIIGKESSNDLSSKFKNFDEKNPEKQFSKDIDLKINNDDDFENFETSRTSKSTVSINDKCGKLSMKKMAKVKSIIGKESISDETSSFEQTSNEKNRKNEFSDDINIKNNKDERSEILETSRSSKSTVSRKNDFEILVTKKMAKIESMLENKLIRKEPSNFRSCDVKNREKKSSHDINVKFNEDETSQSLETSRSLISGKSSLIDWEKFNKKIGKIKSIDGNESFSNDSLNFESCDDKNYDDQTKKHLCDEIDVKIDNDECGECSETLSTLKSTVSPKINCNDLLTKKMEEMRTIVKNLNFESYEEKNNKNALNTEFPRDIDNDENDGKFSEIKNPEKSSFREILEQTKQNRNKEKRENVEIVHNKLNDQNEKSIESLVKKNDNKIEKSDVNENSLSEMKKEPKTNYQRCGTYVIDKKMNYNTDAKHQAPDEFSNDIPLQKRRRTENIESKEDLSKSLNCDESVKKKSIPAEKKDEMNVNNVIEKCTYDRKKCMKNFESTNEPDNEKNENIREFSEKYVNEKFNYESDETLVSENFWKDNEPESSSTKVGKKLSSSAETSIYDFHPKALSDSLVTCEKISFGSTFPRIQEKPEVYNFSALDGNFSENQEIPEAQKSSEISRKLEDKNCQLSNFPRNQEISELQNSLEIRRKSRDKSFIDNSFSRIQETPKVQNFTELARKSRDKNSIESTFSKIPEKPEVQSSIEIERKLREKMRLLRGSTNNLITSMETLDDATTNVRSSIDIEEETIRKIDFRKIGKKYEDKTSFCGFLPEIPIERIIAKNDNTRCEKKITKLDAAPVFSWQRATSNTNARLINLDPPKFHRVTKIPSARLPNIGNLPPVNTFGKEKQSGSCADYDPFLIAERQMNDLLSDTSSEKSLIDCSSNRRKSISPSLPNYPLTHSTAFVKYPEPVKAKSPKLPDKRVSLIAPPTEFDDFSSDSTETNFIMREINAIYDSNKDSRDNNCREKTSEQRRNKNLSRDHVLGRRVIIDKSRALGTNETYDDTASILSGFENTTINGKVRNFFEKTTTPKVTRSSSVRIATGPKVPERKFSSSGTLSSGKINGMEKNRKNNCTSLSGSNVSLSSIVSSEIDVKRSNSLFDELASSYEDDASAIYPSLSSLLKNDSLSVTSPVSTNHPRNGQISDEDFSSPDSYKRQQQEHNKLSADSAYSSLNRKYSNHGRSTTDMAGRHDEDSPLRRRDVDNVAAIARSKMSKFCHECGSKFPETAKFCCECGIRRLAL